MNNTHDFIAIGLGPFNLGLACLTEPIEDLNGLFLEQRPSFDWHPDMLVPGTTLQVPFMADLVTRAALTSRYSFLNYLKQKGRLYSFYIRENFLVLRKEYNQYCQWAAAQLPNIQFGKRVEHVHHEESTGRYALEVRDVATNNLQVVYAKRLVLGTGTEPTVPECCLPYREDLVHSASYLKHKERLQRQKSVTVLGSGQSAAEVFYDLLQEVDEYGYDLHWITRSPRFYPMEYTKLTLEITSPEYIDYFHGLPLETRDRLGKEQKPLYKGINGDLIGEIFDHLYMRETEGATAKVQLRTNSGLVQVQKEPGEPGFDLIFHQEEQDRYFRHQTEGVVLATGYAPRIPDFLEGIRDRIRWDEKGRYQAHRHYAIDHAGEEIYVQNGELHTHGFCAPDLGMGAYRNATLVRELTGREVYPIERKIAFQRFGVSDEESIPADWLNPEPTPHA